MLEKAAIVLFVFWLMGLALSYTMGGMIHILLALAVAVLILNLVQGRRAA